MKDRHKRPHGGNALLQISGRGESGNPGNRCGAGGHVSGVRRGCELVVLWLSQVDRAEGPWGCECGGFVTRALQDRRRCWRAGAHLASGQCIVRGLREMQLELTGPSPQFMRTKQSEDS